MEYIGQIIIFVAALLAIGGRTWHEQGRGIRKLSAKGWITGVLALLGLITSSVVVHRAHLDSTAQSKQISEALVNTKLARARAEDLQTQTQQLETQARQLNAELEHSREVVETLLARSDRQAQQVMAEYVQFDGPRIWRAPNLVFPGSILKLYGFICDLMLRYGEHREVIPAGQGGSRPVEVVVVGHSGEGMSWSLENSSRAFCHGKAFLESTPRTRSPNRSWSEERTDRRPVR